MSLNTSALSTKRRKAIYGLAAACLLSVVAVAVIAANQWFPQAAITSAIENVPDVATSVSAKTEAETSPSAEPTPDSRMEVELVVITPTGFEPDIIRRPAGRVLLVVVNDSSRPRINLRAEMVGGGALIRQIQMPRSKRRWELPVNLPPGRFRIVDTERPNHVLRIEITE